MQEVGKRQAEKKSRKSDSSLLLEFVLQKMPRSAYLGTLYSEGLKRHNHAVKARLNQIA